MNSQGQISRRKKEAWGALAFLAPAVLVYAAFVVVPVADSFRLSVFRWDHAAAEPVFCGLANFARLSHDAVFWSALLHNALLVVLSLVVQLPIAFALAVALSYGTRLRGLFRTVLFAPMVMPTTAIAVLWSMIFLPRYGLVDRLIGLFHEGAAFGWLSEPGWALASVFVTICWRYVGFHLVLFMAGLAALPEEVYDAARVDGASEWEICRHVTVPLMWPVIRVSALLSVIGSLKYFDLVFMMVGGAPGASRELMATYVYRLAFAGGQGRYGYASAVAVVLFLIAFAVAAALAVVRRGGRGQGAHGPRVNRGTGNG